MGHAKVATAIMHTPSGMSEGGGSGNECLSRSGGRAGKDKGHCSEARGATQASHCVSERGQV